MNIHRLLWLFVCLHLFLSLLLLFEVAGFNCWVTIHRATSSIKFELPFNIGLMVLISSSILLSILLYSIFLHSLIPLFFAIATYFPLGFKASIVILSISLFTFSLFRVGFNGYFIYSFIIILCLFEGFSLIHWVLLHPFKFDINFFKELAYAELLSSSLLAYLSPIIFTFILDSQTLSQLTSSSPSSSHPHFYFPFQLLYTLIFHI